VAVLVTRGRLPAGDTEERQPVPVGGPGEGDHTGGGDDDVAAAGLSSSDDLAPEHPLSGPVTDPVSGRLSPS
jgi:hypothetical protein